MFMHGGLVHLGGNMLFLWIFGNNVEDALGPVRFLVFYLLGGFAATALQTTVTLATASDAAAQIPNLGASGAVSAVLGAYFVLLPNATVLTLFFFVIIFFLQGAAGLDLPRGLLRPPGLGGGLPAPAPARGRRHRRSPTSAGSRSASSP